ncbi:MAG: O-antigen ligase family protein [Burkholderiales bacterium]
MFLKDWCKAFALANPLSWLLLAVATYVFLAPNVDFAPELTWHDGQRLGQLALLGMVTFLVLAIPSVSGQALAAWQDLSGIVRWALTCTFGLGALSSLLAPLPQWAFLEWGMSLLLTVLALGIVAGRRELGEKADTVLLLLLYATAMAYAVKTVAVYVSMLLVGPDYGLGFDVRELYTGFSNIRFFGHVQTMLLPFLVLPVMWWGVTRARRVMLWSIPAVWWMLVIGSGTRGTWIALLIGSVAAYFFGGQSGRCWFRWQFNGMIFGAAAYVLFILLIPELLSRPTSFLHRADDIISLSNRELLWAASIDFSLGHPWLGVGPMHFSNVWNPVAAHPHNAVLQWMAEWGVLPALLLTLVFAIAGLSWALRVRAVTTVRLETRLSMMAVALLVALTGAAAQSMVDGVIVMPVSQTLLAVFCGWAMGHYLGERATPVVHGWKKRLVAAVIVLFAAGAVVNGVAPDILHIAQREKVYFESRPPGEILLPRFWAQGWIYK